MVAKWCEERSGRYHKGKCAHNRGIEQQSVLEREEREERSRRCEAEGGALELCLPSAT